MAVPMRIDSEPSLAKLPDYLPRPLIDRASMLRLARGERLFRLGAEVMSVYFVLAGEIKAVRYQPDGRESIMMRSSAGDFFGESAVIVPRYVCDAFSMRDAALAAFPTGLFREQLQTDPAFAFNFAMQMAGSARRQCSRYERLRLVRARDRVMHLLNCEGGAEGVYTLRGPLVDLADELGVEPETLYRVLAELEKDQVIQRSRQAIRVVKAIDPA